ncbi:MAG: peptide deformylase [Alphaproteobacteria bacterium]|nr:peptide deformylase [Alphaproteobacteria bacterium]
MAIREIIVAPDPRLKITAKPVKKVDGEVRRLMDDMLETMYRANGIGLAAPQIGSDLRVVVCDVARQNEEAQPIHLANPEVVWASDELLLREEGCLSVPDHYAEVERPSEVKIRYLDRDGKEQELHAKGLLSVCLQHELEHLDGTLFIDHLSRMKRDIILRKLKKTAKLAEPA